jgi:hypothetical protein
LACRVQLYLTRVGILAIVLLSGKRLRVTKGDTMTTTIKQAHHATCMDCSEYADILNPTGDITQSNLIRSLAEQHEAATGHRVIIFEQL